LISQRCNGQRRLVLTAGITLLLALGVRKSQAANVTLPVSSSLQDELASALNAGQPLVLMVSLDGCPFCKIARENYLLPMRAEQGLHIVQINMQHKELVKDMRGQSKTHEQLIAELKVAIAPTLIFYGGNGVEVAERLVGLGLEDFYGAYLEQRLITAKKALHR
jgi:thioredoxin-related protein